MSAITSSNPLSSRTTAGLWWAAGIFLCVATGYCAFGHANVATSAGLLSIAIIVFSIVTALAPHTNTESNPKVWPYAFLLVTLWGLLIWGFRSANFEGVRYFFLMDDMMISMRYARNLVDGLGLVWNPGERLEGFTNPLWTLFMSASHLLPLPDRLTSVPLLLVSIIAGVICLPLAQRWAQALGANAATQRLVLVAMVVNAVLTSSAVLAFEQTIIATLLMAAVVTLLDDIKTGALRPWGYLCLGIIPLIRMDAAILSAATGLWLIYEHPKRLSVIFCLALAVVPSIAATLARHAYYGEWLPNTYYLKTSGWPGRWKVGMHYAIGFLYSYGWVYLFIALSMLFRRSTWSPAWRATIMISAAQLAYGTYVGGDVLGIYRIYAAAVPLLIVGGLCASSTLFQNKYLVAVVSVALIAAWARPTQLVGGLTEALRQDTGNIELGLKLKQEIPTALVADGYAGSLFYFAPKLRGIDMLGKMDAHIARMPVVHGGTIPGHNKFDFDYSIGERHPEYVIAVFEGTEPSAELLKRTTGNWIYAYHIWNSKGFREHCLPHPMPWKMWRMVYRCDWNEPATTAKPNS